MSKIDNETAELEFNRLCEAWEIDNDTENMTEEDRSSFNGQKAKILNAVRRGRLIVEEDGEVLTYTFAKADTAGCERITIKRPNGAGIISMDRYKDREGIHKTYAVLASMTGKDTSFFSKLDGIDIKVPLAVVALFLAS
ncbi:MAG: hypothetical protein KA369_08280 [Spirochaetes bacterium]|nr:hypothetical protein [Spirochaetota bacterium]